MSNSDLFADVDETEDPFSTKGPCDSVKVGGGDCGSDTDNDYQEKDAKISPKAGDEGGLTDGDQASGSNHLPPEDSDEHDSEGFVIVLTDEVPSVEEAEEALRKAEEKKEETDSDALERTKSPPKPFVRPKPPSFSSTPPTSPPHSSQSPQHSSSGHSTPSKKLERASSNIVIHVVSRSRESTPEPPEPKVSTKKMSDKDAQEQIAHLTERLQQEQSEIASLRKERNILREELEGMRSSMSKLENLLSMREDEIEELRHQKDTEIEELRYQKDAEIQELHIQKDAEIEKLCAQKDAEIEELRKHTESKEKVKKKVHAHHEDGHDKKSSTRTERVHHAHHEDGHDKKSSARTERVHHAHHEDSHDKKSSTRTERVHHEDGHDKKPSTRTERVHHAHHEDSHDKKSSTRTERVHHEDGHDKKSSTRTERVHHAHHEDGHDKKSSAKTEARHASHAAKKSARPSSADTGRAKNRSGVHKETHSSVKDTVKKFQVVGGGVGSPEVKRKAVRSKPPASQATVELANADEDRKDVKAEISVAVDTASVAPTASPVTQPKAKRSPVVARKPAPYKPPRSAHKETATKAPDKTTQRAKTTSSPSHRRRGRLGSTGRSKSSEDKEQPHPLESAEKETPPAPPTTAPPTTATPPPQDQEPAQSMGSKGKEPLVVREEETATTVTIDVEIKNEVVVASQPRMEQEEDAVRNEGVGGASPTEEAEEDDDMPRTLKVISMFEKKKQSGAVDDNASISAATRPLKTETKSSKHSVRLLAKEHKSTSESESKPQQSAEQPETMEEAKTKSSTVPVPKPLGNPIIRPMGMPVGRPVGVTETKSAKTPEVESTAVPELKPSPPPEVKEKPVTPPEPKPVVVPEPKPVVQPEPKLVVQPEPKPVVQPEKKPAVKAEVKQSERMNGNALSPTTDEVGKVDGNVLGGKMAAPAAATTSYGTKDRMKKFASTSAIDGRKTLPFDRSKDSFLDKDTDLSRGSFVAPKREECAVCSKTVYAMERLEADKVVYHKTCFKCSVCNKTLSTGTYAALQGKIYCKVHFKQLFKMKGNYDEGFGREQHKKKWVKANEEP